LGGTVRVLNSGEAVRIGTLPVRALGLRDRFIADEYGNRYIYAVTEKHTSSGNFAAANGAIAIKDNTGAPIVSNASYILLSTGPNGRGAYRYQTGLANATACGTVTATDPLDNENCNDDFTFRDARFNNGSVTNKFFDDFPRWQQKALLVSSTGSSGGVGGNGSNLWGVNGLDIYSVGLDSDTATGRVGIGTNSPDTQLTVGSSARINEVVIGADASGVDYAFASQAIGARFGQNLRLESPNTIVMHTGMTASEPDGESKARLTVATDGKVGIGTSTPDFLLTVQDNGANKGAHINNVVIGASPAAPAATVDFAYPSNTVGVLSGNLRLESPGGIVLHTGMTASENDDESKARITVDSAGRVGIGGTSNPSYILDIAGKTRINGGMDVSGNVAVVGTVTQTSDRRLKKHIKPVRGALNKIAKLQGVSYEWKDQSRGRTGRNLGLIAQDVEKIVPDLVRTDAEGKKLKSINYDGFNALFVEAIKELKAENAQLRADLTEQNKAPATDYCAGIWALLGALFGAAACYFAMRQRR
jgi:hypothetical protein